MVLSNPKASGVLISHIIWVNQYMHNLQYKFENERSPNNMKHSHNMRVKTKKKKNWKNEKP